MTTEASARTVMERCDILGSYSEAQVGLPQVTGTADRRGTPGFATLATFADEPHRTMRTASHPTAGASH